VVEDEPVVLDLMAGIDSYLPPEQRAGEVVGLGLDAGAMRRNHRLDRRILHDLNRDPVLPFPEAAFDVVLCTVSVDYLTRPFEVFAEVARVLAPGGLFLVIVSNRFFPAKAIRLWIESDELTRLHVVEQYFASVPELGPTNAFHSRGKPRPRDDRHAGTGLPSDPITAIYAERRGAPPGRAPRPAISPEPSTCPPPAVVEARKRRVRDTLRCPYCEASLARYEIPPSPFSEWPDELMYVCANDECPYLVDGGDVMMQQGNAGMTHRLVYSPARDRCVSMPTPFGGLRTDGA
jgi:SAM-dependent methyltransferase